MGCGGSTAAGTDVPPLAEGKYAAPADSAPSPVVVVAVEGAPPAATPSKHKKKKSSHADADAQPVVKVRADAPPPAEGECFHSSRIVRKRIGRTHFKSYTGAGTSWGAIKATTSLSAQTPIVEMIVLNGASADGFLVGVSPLNSSLSSLPGSVGGSLAWSPSKGHVVLDCAITSTVTSIVPQLGDRISLVLSGNTLRIELNDGLVARVTLPKGSADPYTPHVALIGGGAVVWSEPTAEEDKATMRADLLQAAAAYRELARASLKDMTELNVAMKKAAFQRAKTIETNLARITEAEVADPAKNTVRSQVKQVIKEEEERTLVRQVKLKLRALRAMMCPTRKSVAMWRKCLVRAQERIAAGFPRSPKFKALAPPKQKAPAVVPPAVAVAVVTSSFRTVSKTKNLAAGIYLDQYQGKTPAGVVQYEWILRNENIDQLIITMDFGKCRGLDLHGETAQKSHIKGYSTKMIAVATQISPNDGYSMSYSIECTTLPPDLADMQAASAADDEEIESAIAQMKSANIVVKHDETDVWQHLVDQLREKQLNFLDEHFPPVSTSVWSKSPSDLAQLPLTWRRLFAFMPAGSQPTLFEPQIDPNDIQQGKLGNCWFCSSLSAVAETPELVVRLFGPNQRVNEQGVYSVRLCITGVWRDIVLDDLFPCFPGAGPAFTKNHGAQLWVLLIEKAFGKVYGGYDRLISGQSHHALADLTGYPVRSYQLEHPESKPLLANNAQLLWQELLEGAREDLSMCAGTVGKEDANDSVNQRLKSVGLVAGHAYTMLSCMEVPMSASTSQGVRLLELRNPWASGEWTGDWSDSSPLWTPELIALMKPQINSTTEDGVFYMQLSDFLAHFASVSTCFIRSPKERPWIEARFPGTFASTAGKEELEQLTAAAPAQMFTMEVKRESSVWAVIYQADVRLPGASPLIDQGVMIVRRATNGQPLEVVCDTKLELNRQTNATCLLQPGSYIVLPYTSGTRMKSLTVTQRDFQLAVFSDEAATIGSLTATPFDGSIYNAALCSLLRKCGTVSIFGKDKWLQLMQLRHGGSHLYACTIDPASPKSFSVTLNCAASVNAHSHLDQSACTRIVPPSELLIFHHLTPLESSQPTSYNVDVSFKAIKA